MNIVVTGALGNISEPLTKRLVQQGNEVTIVSRNLQNKGAIEALGAKAAIGSVLDVAFLTETFSGADAVYLMVPAVNFFDPQSDVFDFYHKTATTYKEAILKSGVTKVVHLSSMGAHLETGAGLLGCHHIAENILRTLPESVSVTSVRSPSFFSNLFGFIPTIKSQQALFSNYSAEVMEPWAAPVDIAAEITKVLTDSASGKTARYIVSEILSGNTLVQAIGSAIGNPELKWGQITDEQLAASLSQNGMPQKTVNLFLEMNKGRENGSIYSDYYQHQSELGKTKLKDFLITDFMKVYQTSNI